jgi:superfamily II DNA or RNA helicase
MLSQKKTLTLKKKPFQVEEQDWYLYEHYCIAYHMKTFAQEAWHWHHVPEEILVKSGFIHSFNELRLKRKQWLEEKKGHYHPVRSVDFDPSSESGNKRREYGIDGIACEMIGDTQALYHAIQCKYWAPSRQLRGDDLGTFYQTLFCRMRPTQKTDKVNGYVYHTCRLQVDVRDDFAFSGMKAIKLPFDEKTKEEQLNPVQVSEEKAVLYPYQVAALDALRPDWSGCGLLHMPCGTGKTVVFLNHVKEKQYDHVFILSPLRVHTKQNLDRARVILEDKKKPEEGYSYCLVDSDQEGTRDFGDILKQYEKGRCVYSSTFASCQDVLSQFFDMTEEETAALPKDSEDESLDDESENEDDSLDTESEVDESDYEEDSLYESSLYEGSTSSDSSVVYPMKYDLSNSLLIVDEAHNLLGNKKLIQLIRSFPKVMLVTATPPCEIHEILQCQTLYTYSMSDAIAEKKICDYRIYLPWIHTKEGEEKPTMMMDIPDELVDMPRDLCLKALFLIKGMLEKGSRRCIVYLSSMEECGEFLEVFKKVNELYHYLPYWISSITSDTKENDRERILGEFVKIDLNQMDRIYILCSIRIFHYVTLCLLRMLENRRVTFERSNEFAERTGWLMDIQIRSPMHFYGQRIIIR